MKDLSSFLGRFKNIVATRFLTKEIVSETVSSIINISVKPECFDFKENIVYIKSNPALKSAIFMKKAEILYELNKKMPVRVVDIR